MNSIKGMEIVIRVIVLTICGDKVSLTITEIQSRSDILMVTFSKNDFAIL